MDASYLSQQVNAIIGQLHVLFDEIGVPNHGRDTREAELFAALSETLHNQVRVVTAEKQGMIQEAQEVMVTIRQMEASLDDSCLHRGGPECGEDGAQITFPLSRCLQALKERHAQVSKLHRERFEQVKKLVQALESYSSHLEPAFVETSLPPTEADQIVPPTFDLSPAYVDRLDNEFTRVYEEYTKRVAMVQALSEEIIQLWAELGTPQAQTDAAIVKYYRDAPEQLGLHEQDIARIRSRRDRLVDEKKNREKRLADLKVAVEVLWEKLGVEEPRRKAFLACNRGCGLRQINEFQDELGRLNELKRQNLHLFVEDARCRLQELWDVLYLSEDEMLKFTPAFSDVYGDALLEAHEREVSRLEALRQQRGPILALVERHKTLEHDRGQLAATSQDASRLMMRGQKGEKRDPGKLLREEKMRKRIAKELPKVTGELRNILERWEGEYGRPFLVHGERYLATMEAVDSRTGPGSRAKTPAGPPPASGKFARSAPRSRANSASKVRQAGQSAQSTKLVQTAAGNTTGQRGHCGPGGTTPRHDQSSPSRIPARAALASLKYGQNSPDRSRMESCADTPRVREREEPMRFLETPTKGYRGAHAGSNFNLRHIEPENVDVDTGLPQQHFSRADSYDNTMGPQVKWPSACSTSRDSPPTRHISNTSTTISGSENWETYDDNSEHEVDASDMCSGMARATRGKRLTPEGGYSRAFCGGIKRQRGAPLLAADGGQLTVDGTRNRAESRCSEWTDEDGF